MTSSLNTSPFCRARNKQHILWFFLSGSLNRDQESAFKKFYWHAHGSLCSTHLHQNPSSTNTDTHWRSQKIVSFFRTPHTWLMCCFAHLIKKLPFKINKILIHWLIARRGFGYNFLQQIEASVLYVLERDERDVKCSVNRMRLLGI